MLDNVDPDTRNFLLKSSLLRSMNDSLIARVTGKETVRCVWKRSSVRGCSCNVWRIPANGFATTAVL
ncbi:hypothetical protein ACLK1Y_18915 [Escherichia coli]